MSEIENIKKDFFEKFKNVQNKEDLQDIKSEFFGKTGRVNSQFKVMATLSGEDKKIFGLFLIRNINLCNIFYTNFT